MMLTYIYISIKSIYFLIVSIYKHNCEEKKFTVFGAEQTDRGCHNKDFIGKLFERYYVYFYFPISLINKICYGQVHWET